MAVADIGRRAIPRPLPPLWLARPSRFAAIGRARSRWVAAVLIALMLLSLAALRIAPPAGGAEGADTNAAITDLQLYEGVIDGIRAGGDYYQITADALRAGSYPLRPFITFRLPLHSVVQAALPLAASLAILWFLAIAVALAWWGRLREALPRTPPRIAAMILLAGGMVAFVQLDLIAFHEIWAGLLVALSLALRRPGRWVEAVSLALVAMLVRETSALYVVVMGGLAWLEGERREAAGWGAALALFALALVAHAFGVARVVSPLDPASPGWHGLMGFGFFTYAVTQATSLSMLPIWLASPLVVLALFGWASWRDPLGKRAALVFAAYALVLSVAARADNFYWGLVIAPVFLVGLAFVPDGLRDLGWTLLDRPRVRVQRVSP